MGKSPDGPSLGGQSQGVADVTPRSALGWQSNMRRDQRDVGLLSKYEDVVAVLQACGVRSDVGVVGKM